MSNVVMSLGTGNIGSANLSGGADLAALSLGTSAVGSNPSPFPEPASLLLLALGGLALGGASTRRQSKTLNCKKRDLRQAINQG
jgi:hypothetical protein